MSKVAEEWERNRGKIVVPSRIERRKAREAVEAEVAKQMADFIPTGETVREQKREAGRARKAIRQEAWERHRVPNHSRAPRPGRPRRSEKHQQEWRDFFAAARAAGITPTREEKRTLADKQAAELLLAETTPIHLEPEPSSIPEPEQVNLDQTTEEVQGLIDETFRTETDPWDEPTAIPEPRLPEIEVPDTVVSVPETEPAMEPCVPDVAVEEHVEPPFAPAPDTMPIDEPELPEVATLDRSTTAAVPGTEPMIEPHVPDVAVMEHVGLVVAPDPETAATVEPRVPESPVAYVADRSVAGIPATRPATATLPTAPHTIEGMGQDLRTALEPWDPSPGVLLDLQDRLQEHGTPAALAGAVALNCLSPDGQDGEPDGNMRTYIRKAVDEERHTEIDRRLTQKYGRRPHPETVKGDIQRGADLTDDQRERVEIAAYQRWLDELVRWVIELCERAFRRYCSPPAETRGPRLPTAREPVAAPDSAVGAADQADRARRERGNDGRKL